MAIIILSTIMVSTPINPSKAESSTLTIIIKGPLSIDSVSADIQCRNFDSYFVVQSLDW